MTNRLKTVAHRGRSILVCDYSNFVRLETSERLRGQSLCCVITGGNVDAALHTKLLAGEI